MSVTYSGDAATTRTSLGLGDAATKTTGTAAGNIPVLDGSGQVAGSILNNAVPADGSITDAKIDGMSSSKLSGALPAIDGSSLTNLPGGGKVLQVVSGNTTNKISVSYQTWGTGVSASITPTSTTSKILIIATLSVNSTGSNVIGSRFLRNSTVVGSLTGNAQYMSASDGSSWHMSVLSNNYLDSPNTTSAITYSLQGFGHENTVTINSTQGDDMRFSTGDSDAASNITLMEIGV